MSVNSKRHEGYKMSGMHKILDYRLVIYIFVRKII